MIGIVLALEEGGLLHALPGAAAERTLPGVRCAALDHRDGLALAAAPGDGVWAHRGDGWRRVREAGAGVVRIDPAGVCWAAAEGPSLHRSADGGESWDELANVPSIVRAHAARRPGVRRGGETPIVGVAFPHGHLLLGLRGVGAWLSRDGGQTWMRGDQIELSARSEPLQATDLGEHLNGLWEHPLLSDRLYAASRRGFFRSDDGGFTWQRAQQGLDRLHADGVAVLPGAPDTLLLSASSRPPGGGEAEAGGALFRSPNAGLRWERVRLGEEDEWARPPLVAAVTGGLAMLFAHAGSRLWASHDGGARWLPIAEDVPPARAMIAAL